MNNIYRQAREEYNKANKVYKEDQLSRKKAAVELSLSLPTLERIEKGEKIPEPDIVIAMSKLYHIPNLRRQHCCSNCMIGETDFTYDGSKSLLEAGYGLHSANKDLGSFKEILFEILADGVVDKNETKQLRNLIPEIKKVQDLLFDINNEIEKHIMKYEL